MTLQMFGHEITLLQILVTVIGIGLLVFVHELGHFMMAKLFKIKVELFALGFGPELVGFTIGETRYSICAIPLGGMIKMPGEDINSASGSKDEFLSQPWYKRLTVALCGPLMNYALAVVIFAAIIFHWGLSSPTDKAVIGELVQGMPAQAAGIQSGDKVLKVDNATISSWEDLAKYIHSKTTRVNFLIERSGQQLIIPVTPKFDAASGRNLIGIAPEIVTEKAGIFKSVDLSVRYVVFQSVFTLRYLGEKITRFEKPELSGPIGVVQYLAKAAKTGPEQLLHLLGVISVALGLFNLLPIPILDGGLIFFSLIEGVTRRPLNKKVIAIANMAGLALIIGIFLFATYSDIARINTALPK
jgi:regulator of sigma E protease